ISVSAILMLAVSLLLFRLMKKMRRKALALVLERRFRVVVCAILVFAVTGGYWYLRNYLLSGDPVHPVGGPVFGFWLWDAGDLASQFDDIGRAALWRHWVYLPALLAVFLWRQSSPFLRGLVVCAAASLLIWYAGSAYWRYAVPIYPMLALLTAWVGTQLWPVTASAILWRRLPRGAGVALLLVLLLASGLQLAKELSRLHPDGESRARYLVAEHAGHALLASLPELPGRVLYQLGFEDQIYYLPSATIGDWFGPARYADVMALSGDAQALARHLEQLGADMLLVNLRRAEFPTFDDNPGMEEHFQLLARSDQAALYLRVGPRERGPVSVQGVTGK
ncbi:MAG: hypothetical protein RJQ10_14255, partial [Haliea sp.]|uniref:hypothetical protein n=1 Tax=Haliea sp. TaxID=1932666 RepID=UPI0032EE7AB9